MFLLSTILFIVPPFALAETLKGSVILDEVTFGKIIPKHEIVLVKFDQMYPWGDHLKEYKNLVERLSSHEKILLAEVPVADFGEKQNAKLAQKYQVKTKTYDYPQYRLFLRSKGLEAPFEYKGNNNAEDLTKFIILTSGTWLQLPGCVAAFDDLIEDFLNKTADEREKVIEAGTTLLAGWTGSPEDETAAKTYLKIMRRLTSVEGDAEARKALLEEDLKRTDKIMMLEQVHPDKLLALKMKMNIIGSFFYNGLASAGPPTFNNEDIRVLRKDDMEDEEEEEDEKIDADEKGEVSEHIFDQTVKKEL